MTKAELIDEVARQTGIERLTVEKVFKASLNVIKDTLISGDSCYFRGFGTFFPKLRAAKKARNISKGISVSIPAHYVACYKAGTEVDKGMKQLKVK